MIHGHPYAYVLLGLTQIRRDKEMLEALDMEFNGSADKTIAYMVAAFEAVCDTSFRDRGDNL